LLSRSGPTQNQCRVTFSVSFKFRSLLHAVFAQKAVVKVQKEMMAAFLKRCEQIYGVPKYGQVAQPTELHKAAISQK